MLFREEFEKKIQLSSQITRALITLTLHVFGYYVVRVLSLTEVRVSSLKNRYTETCSMYRRDLKLWFRHFTLIMLK